MDPEIPFIIILIILVICGGVIIVADIEGVKNEWSEILSLLLITVPSVAAIPKKRFKISRNFFKICEEEAETDIDMCLDAGRRLSIGVYILTIFFLILGALWVVLFFITSVQLTFFTSFDYFFYGVTYLIGSVGMLKRKHWALRFSQVFLILNALIIVVTLLVGRLLLGKAYNTISLPFVSLPSEPLFMFLFFLIFFGLPIWFLFKKSTAYQFKRRGLTAVLKSKWSYLGYLIELLIRAFCVFCVIVSFWIAIRSIIITELYVLPTILCLGVCALIYLGCWLFIRKW